MRTICVVSVLGLAACGGKAGSEDRTDASATPPDAASSPDGAIGRDGGLEASACAFAGFGAATAYSAANLPSSVFVYSPTGGVPNLIAVEPNAAPHTTFELFANRGDGTFALATFHGAVADFTSAVSADFDGDGLADIAGETPSPTSDGSLGRNGSLQIDRNIGGGAFASQVATYSTPQTSGYLAVGDFDRDGHLDIAMAGATIVPRPDGVNVDSAGLDLFFNNGRGSFASPIVYTDSQGFGLERIAAADFDGDGSPDLGLFPGGPFLNSGTGTFGAELPLPPLPDDASSSPLPFWAAGDFNRDGKSDLVAAVAPNEIAVFLAVGGGSFAAPVTYATGSTPSVVAVGDFNGDSYPDVVVLLDAQTASSSLGLYLNQGDGAFGAETKLVLGPYAVSIGTADFNGDGVTDLAVGNDGFADPDGGGVNSVTVALSRCL